jgi:hypothetical protein
LYSGQVQTTEHAPRSTTKASAIWIITGSHNNDAQYPDVGHGRLMTRCHTALSKLPGANKSTAEGSRQIVVCAVACDGGCHGHWTTQASIGVLRVRRRFHHHVSREQRGMGWSLRCCTHTGPNHAGPCTRDGCSKQFRGRVALQAVFSASGAAAMRGPAVRLDASGVPWIGARARRSCRDPSARNAGSAITTAGNEANDRTPAARRAREPGEYTDRVMRRGPETLPFRQAAHSSVKLAALLQFVASAWVDFAAGTGRRRE